MRSGKPKLHPLDVSLSHCRYRWSSFTGNLLVRITAHYIVRWNLDWLYSVMIFFVWFGFFLWINLVKCYFFFHPQADTLLRLSNVRPACKHPWYARVMSHNLGGLVSDPHPPTLDSGGQELRLWSCLLSLSETWLQRGRSAWTISRTVTWNLDFLYFVQQFSIQHKESAIFYECLRSLRGCCFPPWWEVHTGIWHLYVWGRK